MMLQFGREISFAMLDLWLQCGQKHGPPPPRVGWKTRACWIYYRGVIWCRFLQLHSTLFTTPRKMARVLPSANHFPLHQLFLEMCFVN